MLFCDLTDIHDALSLCSFNEIALIDFPAIVDYITTLTRQPQLFYVGHSQGTAMGFAGFSSNKTLSSRVRRFYALAPITTIKHIWGGMRILSDGYRFLSVREC